MRITTLIGAGGVAEIGGASTWKLTNEACNTVQDNYDIDAVENPKIQFIKSVKEALDINFRKEKGEEANFEDLLDALEIIDSYQSGWRKTTAKNHKPRGVPFLSPRDLAWYKPMLVTSAQIDLFNSIAKNVDSYVKNYKPTTDHKWFADFWAKLTADKLLDVGVLNYDNCIEKSLSADKFTDGYEPVAGADYSRFNENILLNDSLTRIMHMHGNITYGYTRIEDSNRFILHDGHEDLYKYNEFEKAMSSWHYRSTTPSQDGTSKISGPIITGLGKTDKVSVSPYNAYCTLFNGAIMKNKSLLVVGYSFGDVYINRIIERMNRIHGSDRRIVLITFFPQEDIPGFDISYLLSERIINRSMADFIWKSFNDENPIKNSTYQDMIESKDKCARIYCGGFKNAVEKYGDNIMDFLNK